MCPTYGLCLACRAQSQICMYAICVYAMKMCVMPNKIGVLLGQTKLYDIWCGVCPTYGLCRACRGHSQICMYAICVYAMNI